jgi:hypothetical protein
MNFFDRLREKAEPESEPAAVERLLRERFRFLEERQGFELARSRRLADGAAVAYANRPAGRGVVIFARSTRGAWAGVGALAPDGELKPLDREAIARGEWRELRRIDVNPGEPLDEALTGLALALGGTSA